MARQQHRLPRPDKVSSTVAWSDPELQFWLRAWAHLENGRRSNLLDVGCGMGRIIAKLGRLFSNVVCLEPDATRIAAARKEARKAGSGLSLDRLRFVHQTFDLALSDVRRVYDAITCVQALQHLPSDQVLLWVAKMYRLLRPGGVAVVATTWSTSRKLTVEGLPSAPAVSRKRFDAAARGAEPGKLAVQWFSQKQLKQIFLQQGFRILEHSPFSWLDGSLPLSQFLIVTKNSTKAARRQLSDASAAAAPLPSPPMSTIPYSEQERLALAIQEASACATTRKQVAPCPAPPLRCI